jgi:hypothetical protein
MVLIPAEAIILNDTVFWKISVVTPKDAPLLILPEGAFLLEK